MTKKRLGRGLDSLLGHENGGSAPSSIDSAELIRIPLEKIEPNPFQPRSHIGETELLSLAESIKQHGVIQPIIVRTNGENYQLIAGERRLRACMIARVQEIPARVLELDDRRVAELAIIENLQRTDLNSIDKAQAFHRYLAKYECTQEDLASRLGIDRSTVSNLVRLLELPDEVLQAIRNDQITQGHGRALLPLDSAEKQIAACQRIIEESLSVRQTESLIATGDPGISKPRIRKEAAAAIAPQAAEDNRPQHFQEFEQYLKTQFGTPVYIKPKSKEKGQIVIEFNNQEEFERISALIRMF